MPNATEIIPAMLVGLFTVPLTKFIVCVATEGSKKQASIGKMLIGVKVTDEQGRPIGYGKAFGRNIAKLVGIATLGIGFRSEEHTSELQSLMRISYAVLCLKKNKKNTNQCSTLR